MEMHYQRAHSRILELLAQQSRLSAGQRFGLLSLIELVLQAGRCIATPAINLGPQAMLYPLIRGGKLVLCFPNEHCVDRNPRLTRTLQELATLFTVQRQGHLVTLHCRDIQHSLGRWRLTPSSTFTQPGLLWDIFIQTKTDLFGISGLAVTITPDSLLRSLNNPLEMSQIHEQLQVSPFPEQPKVSFLPSAELWNAYCNLDRGLFRRSAPITKKIEGALSLYHDLGQYAQKLHCDSMIALILQTKHHGVEPSTSEKLSALHALCQQEVARLSSHSRAGISPLQRRASNSPEIHISTGVVVTKAAYRAPISPGRSAVIRGNTPPDIAKAIQQIGRQAC